MEFSRLTPYEKAMALQADLRDQVQRGVSADYLLLLHHPPLITRGISERGDSGLITPRRQLEEEGIPVYDVDRGGKTTFHGPGQLVGYPIFDLKRRNLRTREFVERVANVSGKHFGLLCPRRPLRRARSRRDDRRQQGGVSRLCDPAERDHAWFRPQRQPGRYKMFEHIIPCGKVGRKITSMEMVVNRPFPCTMSIGVS
jgi:lipoyl(octanoyl) transferase